MLQKIESFFSGNKVFFIGLLGAVGITLQQFLTQPTVDYKALILAAVTAIVAFASKNITGTLTSLAGVVGSTLIAVTTAATYGGKIDWSHLALAIGVAVIGLVTGGAQSTKTQS